MDWWLILAGIAVVLVVLVVIFTTGPTKATTSTLASSSCNCSVASRSLSPPSLLLPTSHYYTWMLVDAELATNPLLDIPYPLPSFRTLPSVVQVVDKYSFDLNAPIGSKYRAPGDEAETDVLPFLSNLLKGILEEEASEFTLLSVVSESAGCYRLTLEMDGELHDLLLGIKQLAEEVTIASTRDACPTIGYFSHQIVHQNKARDIIQRYTTSIIQWQVTPDIPTSYYPVMQEAIEYWNRWLEKDDEVGSSRPRLHLNLTPFTSSLASPSLNLFTLAHSSGYVGVGTTAIDHRTGQHSWSRIALDPTSIESQISLFPSPTAAVNQQRYDSLLLFTLIHELGHTLGLRHNFIAQVDGNSSYMAYLPTYTADTKGNISFLTLDIKGEYDAAAIGYGYGVETGVEVGASPHLFHTDENIDTDKILSQVHRHSHDDGLTAAKNWMLAFRLYRPRLFAQPELHALDVRRVFFFLTSITTAVSNSLSYIGGYTTDHRRQRLISDDRSAAVLNDVVTYLTGDSWRLEELSNHLTNVVMDPVEGLTTTTRPWKGRYTVDKAPLDRLHLQAVLRLARGIFTPERVESQVDAGKLLARLVKGIGPVTDALRTNVIVGVLATIDYYRDKYTTHTALALDRVVKQVVSQLGEGLAAQVMDRKRGMGVGLEVVVRERGGCGNPCVH